MPEVHAVTAAGCACDPGAGVFAFGCTQHRGVLPPLMPGGESTSAQLRRLRQEWDTQTPGPFTPLVNACVMPA